MLILSARGPGGHGVVDFIRSSIKRLWQIVHWTVRQGINVVLWALFWLPSLVLLLAAANGAARSLNHQTPRAPIPFICTVAWASIAIFIPLLAYIVKHPPTWRWLTDLISSGTDRDAKASSKDNQDDSPQSSEEKATDSSDVIRVTFGRQPDARRFQPSFLAIFVQFVLVAVAYYIASLLGQLSFNVCDQSLGGFCRWPLIHSIPPIELNRLALVYSTLITGFTIDKASPIIQTISGQVRRIGAAVTLHRYEENFRDAGRATCIPDVFFGRAFHPTQRVNVHKMDDLATYCREVPYGNPRKTLCIFHIPKRDSRRPQMQHRFDRREISSAIDRYFDPKTSEILFLTGDRAFVAHCMAHELQSCLSDTQAGPLLIDWMGNGDIRQIQERFPSPGLASPSNYEALYALIKVDGPNNLIVLDERARPLGRVERKTLVRRLMVPEPVVSRSKQLEKAEEEAPLEPPPVPGLSPRLRGYRRPAGYRAAPG